MKIKTTEWNALIADLHTSFKEDELFFNRTKPWIEKVFLLIQSEKTPWGSSAIQHAIWMINHLKNLRLELHAAVVILLYVAVVHAKFDLDLIKNPELNQLKFWVLGILKIDKIKQIRGKVQSDLNIAKHKEQSGYLHRMLLAMMDNWQIMAIKLADQLALLQGLKYCSNENRLDYVKEVEAIYIPLANLLGLSEFKWKLEDRVFYYIHPESYKEIANHLRQKRTFREQQIQRDIEALTHCLEQAHIKPFKVTGRAKSLYGIYIKIKKKAINFDALHDIMALRLFVNKVSDCYDSLSAVHAKWQAIPEAFDDYIATPKINGYQSIHTAIRFPDGHIVEVQIRTYAMHHQAEWGVAAHWAYKAEGKPVKVEGAYTEKLHLFRQMIAWQRQVTDSHSHFSESYLQERLYVFTPKGDIKSLSLNATPLDFAYAVHTEVGHACRGAKVNQRIVTLKYQLKTGDQVEILTQNKAEPSADWMNPHAGYLVTTKARAKVRQWHQKYGCLVNAPKISVAVSSNTSVSEPPVSAKRRKKFSEKRAVIVEGIPSLLTYFAACCSPVPGDAIGGYITQGRGVSIHRLDCLNLQRLLTDYPQKSAKASWETVSEKGGYFIDFRVKAKFKENLLGDISEIIYQTQATIVKMHWMSSKQRLIKYIHIALYLQGSSDWLFIFQQLQKLKDVIEVVRK